MVKKEVHHQHNRPHKQCENAIYTQAYTHIASNLGFFVACEQCPYQRGEAIGKSYAGKQTYLEEIVDKRSGGQLGGAVPSYHNIVGETHGNIAQLPNEQRQSQGHNRAV